MSQKRRIGRIFDRIRSVLAHYGFHKLDEEELAVVEQYRVWVAHQRKLAGGGCGGCPSQGGCSDPEADVGDSSL